MYKPCCEYLLKMNLGWMITDDQSTLLMPYIQDNKNSEQKWRVNHCPSCGTYIRDIQLPYEDQGNTNG